VKARAGGAVEDGGAGEAFLSQALEQGEMQRLVVPTVRLTDEHPGQHLFAGEDPHRRDSWLIRSR
jgi:hypothetical protein